MTVNNLLERLTRFKNSHHLAGNCQVVLEDKNDIWFTVGFSDHLQIEEFPEEKEPIFITII